MDLLTHALSGALLARTTTQSHAPGRLSVRARVAGGCVAAVSPDADIVLRPLSTLTYLDLHQGYTHSLVMLPLWALGLAALFSIATRRRYGWRDFYGIATMGIAIHIALDLITAYGTMLFAPFSTRRYSLPLAYVVDPYLTAIIAAALLAAVALPARRWAAAAGLAALAAYAGMQGWLHSRAIAVGAAHARTEELQNARSHALPQPLSPFNWKVVVTSGDHYRVADVSLLDAGSLPRLPLPGVFAGIANAYQPAAAAQWRIHHRYGTAAEDALAQEAWHHPEFAAFRRFAVYPALDHVTVAADGAACVWFVDLRFMLPALAPSFRFGLCRPGAQAQWQLQRLRGDFLID